MKHTHIYIALAAFVLLGACAPAKDNSPTPRAATGGTTLMVKNDHFNDVVIYLLRGSARTRIGSVTAMGRAEFKLPAAYVVGVSDVTVQAAAVGSNDSYISPSIMIFPGAQLALTVGSALRLSNFAVYAAN